MKIARLVIQIVVYIILSILVIFSLYTFVSEQIMKKDYVNLFGYSYFVVSTGSMEPELSVNDIIIVKLGSSYKNKDIITYKDGNSYITHRIISIKGNSIIAKGDANNAADSSITRDVVIGKVVKYFPLGSILKLIGGILILYVLISVVNFEKIFKKYAIKEDNPEIDKIIGCLLERKSQAEVLNIEGEEKIDDNVYDFMNDVAHILDVDREPADIYSSVTVKKLEYVYRIALLAMKEDSEEFKRVIEIPNFDVKIDYDLNKINFTKNIREKLDNMPLYVYLKIMLIALLYGKDDFYDVIYKVMKVRVSIDSAGYFITSNDKNEIEEVIWALETLETVNTKVNLNLSKERKYVIAKEDLDES